MIEVTTYALSRIQVTYIYGAKSCHPNNRWGGGVKANFYTNDKATKLDTLCMLILKSLG